MLEPLDQVLEAIVFCKQGDCIAPHEAPCAKCGERYCRNHLLPVDHPCPELQPN